AIDLAAITEHVTILEYSDKMKADSVLLDRLHSLENVTVVTHAQTTEITGTDTVNGLTYTDTKTNNEEHIELSGVFVQIGLVPNTPDSSICSSLLILILKQIMKSILSYLVSLFKLVLFQTLTG